MKLLGASFGGINLEDIKAPECFVIEQRLRELMTIPVFHDDQHGTAIISAAGLINACDLTGRDLSEIKVVCNEAGAAGVACVELIKAMGARPENVILCDTGRHPPGSRIRHEPMEIGPCGENRQANPGRSHEGADAFFGLSAKGAVTRKMVQSMASRPIIFAMANPDPEIAPEEVKVVAPDAIVATGRSDYPNQINNVLGFPTFSRRARRSGIDDQRRHESRRGQGHRRTRPGRRAGRGRRRLFRFPPLLRSGLPDPGALRPSLDQRRSVGRRQGRHG